MAALTASTASAEWEMVYVVSCVAMPTMAALVVMLARWKGRKPSAVPLSKTPAEETVMSQVSCSDSLALRNASIHHSMQCRKRVGKCKAEENKEKIIRRVTSCPDFAVVRVVKASGKVPRQVSYSNLKDRKLQEEIARLADRLLCHAERQCEQGPDCECWDGCGSGERCDSWEKCNAVREREQMNGKRVWRGVSLSERGRKACASIEALLERKATAKRAKRAEVFVTKGFPLEKERGPGSNTAGATKEAAMQESSGVKVEGQSHRLKLESKEMGRFDYYNQLRSEFCNTRSASQEHWTGQLASVGQCSIVKFWAETTLAKGQPGGFGRWVSEQPEGFGHNQLWSVSSDGVVESWDSRAGQMPALCHYLRLQDGERVGGLEVFGSQLLVNVGGRGEIVLDGRKLSEAAMGWQVQ